MNLTVNGRHRDLPEGVTVADVVSQLVGDRTAGTAAAVNSEVVPRSTWRTVSLQDGDEVEVLTAVAGG